MMSAKPMWFSDLRTEVFRLHHQSDYQGALALIDREGARHTDPAQAATVIYWRACFLSLLNQPDEAVAALQDGLSNGFWWGDRSMLYDPDLAILQEREDFKAIIEESQRRNAAAPVGTLMRRESPPELGENLLPSPLLLALHGYGGNAEETLPHWARFPDKRFWWVVAIQSRQRAGMNGFHWVHQERAIEDVQAHLQELEQRKGDFDWSRLAFGGISNGGRMALLVALTQPILIKHVISICGSLSDEMIADMNWAWARSKTMKITLIGGEEDQPTMERLIAQAALFREYGLEVDLQIIPGLGHDYPPDFHDRLAKALAWLT